MLVVIFLSLALALSINLIMFLVAFQYRSDKLTDISYAVSFISLDIMALYGGKAYNKFSIILFLLVILWAVRIGSFLLYRILKVGKDKRFDQLRDSFVGFGKFWLGQAITAWVLMLPVTISLYKGYANLRALIYIGVVIWLIGLIIETAADTQKIKFKNNPKNKDKWINNGIWSYSRHPNYFGEIAIWAGIYVYAFPALSYPQRLICLASPLLITLVLRYVSGVPILEKSADKKWGKDSAYKSYKSRTNLIIPFPPSKK
jgi:steroid 5-alpha reductase family enzyme